MKPIRFIELLANIRANIVAFFSISMFVCLGVGLFLGIQWGSVALRNAAQELYDEGNLHDIELTFPYGITDDDLKKVKAVDGVTDAETGYTAFAVMKKDGTRYTFKFQSTTSKIDLPVAVQGTMPAKKNEVALLQSWALTNNYKIGDTIELVRDEESSSSDKDGMKMLTTNKFEVTALIDHPGYIARNTASFGLSNVASGAIDCVAFVTEDAFDTEKFPGGPTNVYVRCASLDGINTYAAEYRERISPIVDEVTKLGGELGSAQYNKIYGEAKAKVDDGAKKIADGEKQLADGKQELKDGEKLLADGRKELADKEQQLADGKAELADKQASGAAQLDQAYKTLTENQAKYDAGLAQYNSANALVTKAATAFEENRELYDSFIEFYQALRKLHGDFGGSIADLEASVNEIEGGAGAAGKDAVATDQGQQDPNAVQASASDAQTPVPSARELNSTITPAPEQAKDWSQADAEYAELAKIYAEILEKYGSLVDKVKEPAEAVGITVPSDSLPQIDDSLSHEDAAASIASLREADDLVGRVLNLIENASVTIEGTTIRLLDIPAGLASAKEKLASSKATLDSSKAQLDAGWAAYNANKAAYDQGIAAGRAEIASGEEQLAEGKRTLDEKSNELADGKRTLAEKSAELEKGKEDLAEGKKQLEALIEYQWIVIPRTDTGGVQYINLVATMMDNVRWAMASLFVVVGLFVCYSAVSRLVHEEITQIGAKKALGFREGEIATSYLAFAGLAVVIGVVLSVALELLVVQAIMNPKAYKQFTIPPYDPHFDIVDLLVVGGLEFVLILASTWIAIHGMLKRNAIDLLRGESVANAKERFYERTRLWKSMSLFSQTIVNNCINDKRRVVGTIIGVVGCTALIVTAVTLQGNVAQSLTRHYENVFSYDAVTYFKEGSETIANDVTKVLDSQGVASAPAFVRSMQVRQSDGDLAVAKVFVPTDEKKFNEFYHVHDYYTGQEANLDEGGLWVSVSFAEHAGAKVGDELRLTENTGKVHTFKIAGFFEYYLLRHEFVMSAEEYRQAFGEQAEPNILMARTGDHDLAKLRDKLDEVDGYYAMTDDYDAASYSYRELQEILTTVVLIYLALSALMAIVVLLNLDVMFVNEKKRELIVLMINGFSTKAAKGYISRDSIALTVIGIVLGVALGAYTGGVTVTALEPATGFFVKDFNVVAALTGAVGAGVFSMAVLFYALRLIPRFKLTDINRF